MKKIFLFASMLLGVGVYAQTPRLVLYEEFTGENCIPCAGVNPGLDGLLAQPTNSTKCVPIKWQVPIPSTPTNTWSLYQTNKTEIDWRYLSTGAGGYGYAITSAPSGKMDGQNVTTFGASTDNPTNLTSSVIATAQSFTSAFNITMNRDWNVGCTAVTLTINIQATANFTAVGPLVFRTVMVERHIHFNTAPGSNGEKDFEDVAVRSYPSLQTGTVISGMWTNGQSLSFTLNCVIPPYIRKKAEIAFVGFIQDDGNKKVAQAARCGKQALPDDAMAVAGKLDVVCTTTFSPKVLVKNNGLNPITAMTITPYVDGVAGAPSSWTGNLAASTSTNLTLSTFNTPAAVGPHTFSFIINAMNATDLDLSNNSAKVSFAVASSFQGTPIAEGFVSAAFPPPGFTNVNSDDNPGWIRVNSTGLGGYGLSSQSAKQEFYANTIIGDQDELILPPIDLTGSSTPYLVFDLAYAQRKTTNNDKLEVLVTDNCGLNWTSVYSKSGSSLTIVSPYDGSEYFPGSNEWRTEIVALTGFNSPSVLVKFVTTNDNGNNLYLDNINLSLVSPLGIETNNNDLLVELFPNPADDYTYLKIISKTFGNATVKLVNAIGQTMSETETTLTIGSNLIRLGVNELSQGIYSVIIASEKNRTIKLLMVN